MDHHHHHHHFFRPFINLSSSTRPAGDFHLAPDRLVIINSFLPLLPAIRCEFSPRKLDRITIPSPLVRGFDSAANVAATPSINIHQRRSNYLSRARNVEMDRVSVRVDLWTKVERGGGGEKRVNSSNIGVMGRGWRRAFGTLCLGHSLASYPDWNLSAPPVSPLLDQHRNYIRYNL